MPMYGYFPAVGKKGLKNRKYVAVTGTLARCCGILPQGQQRHNVNLSGCCTGHWQHVSHTMPRQLRAVELPAFPLLSVNGEE